LYVYQSGQIKTYTGAADVEDLSTGTPSSTLSGTSVTYQPKTDLRWGWTETASLHRDIKQLTPDTDWSVSNWVWDYPTGQPNNPWSYINPATGYAYTDPRTGLNVPIGHTFVQSGLPVFQEKISGYSYYGAGWLIYYHVGHYGFAPDGSHEADGTEI